MLVNIRKLLEKIKLEADYEKVGGKVVSLPAREDIDTQVDELLVVEFYSK